MLNIKKLVRTNIANLNPYATARDDFEGKARVFLDANEFPFENGLNRYPDPLQYELKEKIASYKGLSPENIVLGNGSDEVLDLLVRAFCEPGIDNLLVPAPSYGMYKVLADINGVETREIFLNKDFSMNAEAVLKRTDENSKILFLCSPNNPTGNALEREPVTRLLKEFQGLVVIDEAYVDFCPEKSFLPLLDKYNNLVVTQTFSKARGLAGIRLGMAFASLEIAGLLSRVKYPYNINDLTKEKALDMLKGGDVMVRNVARVAVEKGKLEKELNKIPAVEKLFPSDANFFLVRFKDASKTFQSLLHQGIVVRDRSTMPLCENCLRITVGTMEENKQLIEAIINIKS